jgi:rifampicin phosphotransferase
MNPLLLSIEEINDSHIGLVGGKALSLAKLYQAGFNVPTMTCVTTRCYDIFLDLTGLRERILLELNRKDFSDMRWEEIWDASLRIRNMFHHTDFPSVLTSELAPVLENRFSEISVVVRSSAPGEDSLKTSFAGLHDSFVNISGPESILDHIKLVWASLWSDSALLYRQELGLSIEKSAMAVVVQEIVTGDCSGVVFSKSPTDPVSGVVEAVYGLNQGLVDGVVVPDRWILDRSTRKIRSHLHEQRQFYMVPAQSGIFLEKLPENLSDQPPLNNEDVQALFDLAIKSEQFFRSPQDMEWTQKANIFYVLQSRPISTLNTQDQKDERQWYLSLHRSFENLKSLRNKIENELIPEMVETTEKLSSVNLSVLSNQKLADEIKNRAALNQKWVDIYWAEFIPYAHGIRLFGQVYNDTVKPENPYEFIDLLAQTGMASMERNRQMEHLASMLRKSPVMAEKLKNLEPLSENIEEEKAFIAAMDRFVESYGDLSCPVTGTRECSQGADALIRLVLEMASHPPVIARQNNIDILQNQFLDSFEGKQKEEARELLELGRSSYRLRDDDNIHLGRIEAQLIMAVNEAKIRLQLSENHRRDENTRTLLQDLVKMHDRTESSVKSRHVDSPVKNIQARQLLGQPASNGISRGFARVIAGHIQLSEFKHGEILVCDAVDPNMTFVVPLAAGIVERRGGMLIHGAIIAREYGLACVTGVPNATTLIRTGDYLTVDGFLGIVTIGKE